LHPPANSVIVLLVTTQPTSEEETMKKDPALMIDRLPVRAIPAICRALEERFPGARAVSTTRVRNARGEIRVSGLADSERFAAVQYADELADRIRA
jgi:hypothetical protein